MADFAVFSDLVYTLMHTISEYESELVRVERGRYIPLEAISLIQQIRNTGATFTLVTGSGQRTYDSLKGFVPHDSAIIEQGGVIYINGVRDEKWEERMAPVRPVLADFGETLIGLGYSLDTASMGTTSLRMHRYGADRIVTQDEIDSFVNRRMLNNGNGDVLVLPQGIIAVKHTIDRVSIPPSIDFVSELSGKENAISYVLDGLGLSWDRAICLGDDFNDEGMLRRCGFAVVIGNADESIKALAREKASQGKGYVSRYSGHAGTVDILKRVLEYTRA